VEAFAALLADQGRVRGLIGPREVPRLWERHLLNCGVLSDLMPAGATVADIGSGAGLPGLVVALRRPDLQVTLIEPLLRRTTFLDEAVEELGLGNVEVVRARAEQLHGERTFAVVTSRAVAPLDRLLRWSLPLTEPGGQVLAMKGASAAEELAEVEAVLPKLGAADAEIVHIGSDLLTFPTTVVRVEAARDRPLRWGATARAGGRKRSRRSSRSAARSTEHP
jgi:16S rRNA (guanine527-N7)-methyltransferase